MALIWKPDDSFPGAQHAFTEDGSELISFPDGAWEIFDKADILISQGMAESLEAAKKATEAMIASL